MRHESVDLRSRAARVSNDPPGTVRAGKAPRPRPTATDDDLRRLWEAVAVNGWHAADGRLLLTVLGDRCRCWAARLDAYCGLPRGHTHPDDLLSAAWRVLDQAGPRVVTATSPWAYLWNAVRNEMATQAVGAAMQSSTAMRSVTGGDATWRPPLRVGEATEILDRAQSADNAGLNGVTDRWSPALHRLLDIIVEHGGDPAFWAEAIDRAVDVMADARHSYQEYELRRDRYLRDTLGLRPAELSALAALLVGPRRGDRSRRSLLLALHHDLGARPQDVDGAARRLAIIAATDNRVAQSARLNLSGVA